MSLTGSYITHNAILATFSDITGANLSGYMQVPRDPRKDSYYFFHICISAPPHDL